MTRLAETPLPGAVQIFYPSRSIDRVTAPTSWNSKAFWGGHSEKQCPGGEELKQFRDARTWSLP